MAASFILFAKISPTKNWRKLFGRKEVDLSGYQRFWSSVEFEYGIQSGFLQTTSNGF